MSLQKYGFWAINCIFGPKISFFLRYAHTTHFFGLKQIRLNGIIFSPYPQVTLDTFGFPVDVRSAAQQAVFWPRLPKNGPFWAENAIFLRYAHITHFFGLRQTRLNGIPSSPYPKVTLDAFGFPVDARLSARQVVFWQQLPKMALFRLKMLFFYATPI